MKFLVVDDHALIREAMRGILAELQKDSEVLEASTCAQAMDLIERHPDLGLVLLDVQLPDRDGFEALADLRERYPAISVVMLSAFNDRDNVVKALDTGALGFIPKTNSREVLLSALRLVLAGGVYIPPNALARTPTAAPIASPAASSGERIAPSAFRRRSARGVRFPPGSCAPSHRLPLCRAAERGPGRRHAV
jgi:DNA-binding NarL/FixJ family response regulator